VGEALDLSGGDREILIRQTGDDRIELAVPAGPDVAARLSKVRGVHAVTATKAEAPT
jgi:hypothetical protein